MSLSMRAGIASIGAYGGAQAGLAQNAARINVAWAAAITYVVRDIIVYAHCRIEYRVSSIMYKC